MGKNIFGLKLLMNRERPFLNKHTKLQQKSIEDSYHLTNLQKIKPLTHNFPFTPNPIILNNRKGAMLNESRFTQIERDNKLLLQKISAMMKRSAPTPVKPHSNRSLNQIVRRHELEQIETDNARLLRRLQHKRPTYATQRFNKDWLDTKEVIKRMSNYPFHLTNISACGKSAKANSTSKCFYSQSPSSRQTRERRLVLSGIKLNVCITLDEHYLKIVGSEDDVPDLKVIQIQHNEGREFIERECGGSMDALFEFLRYDRKHQTMYLVSLNGQTDFNPEQVQPKHRSQTELKKLVVKSTEKGNMAGKSIVMVDASKEDYETEQFVNQSQNKITDEPYEDSFEK